MHAELFCRFTLIAAVTRKYLEDVLLLKLAHGVGISNTSSVHLEDEVVEFAFQSRGLPFVEWRGALVGIQLHDYTSQLAAIALPRSNPESRA